MPPHNNTLLLFTDAATSPQYEMAVGAFIFIGAQQFEAYLDYTTEQLIEAITHLTTYVEYQSKKSTWAEIKTVIHALEINQKNPTQTMDIEIYTDCQSLCDLMGKRKEKLKKNQFITRSGKVHQHAALYQELFAMTDNRNIKILKIKGHAHAAQRVTLHERIFAILDKLSRKKLRAFLK